MDAPKTSLLALKLLPAALLMTLYSPALLAQSVTTVMTYDVGGNVTSVTDPRGLVTSYTHDGLGHLLQQVSPDTGTVNYAYDGYGRPSSMTRADGVQTTYGYDGINRLTTVSAGGLTQTYAYDNCTNGLGRLCSDSDATGATSYSYTPEGWTGGRGFTMGSTTYALGFSYDAMGRVTVVNYPDSNQAVYAYTNGVVSGVSLKIGSASPINGASAITYRPMDMAMSAWTSSNGLTNTLSYDTDGRLTGISVPGKQSLGFTYDAADRITQITNGIDNTLTQNFGYDYVSRLTSVYSSVEN
ncbi:YD repeat-containing protein, partial [Rhodanobacter sp. K2T2]|nr:YD repeat-containing protein [Rhodanobacter sp. K2T2]